MYVKVCNNFTGIPRASISCEFAEERNRYQFVESTLFAIDCDETKVDDIISNVTLNLLDFLNLLCI